MRRKKLVLKPYRLDNLNEVYVSQQHTPTTQAVEAEFLKYTLPDGIIVMLLLDFEVIVDFNSSGCFTTGIRLLCLCLQLLTPLDVVLPLVRKDLVACEATHRDNHVCM